MDDIEENVGADAVANQGKYKNRVKNDIFFLKFPLFYLANEEIQSGIIQNNIYIYISVATVLSACHN